MRSQLLYQAAQVQQVSVAVFCVGVKRKEPDRKETSMLFSDHDRSLLKGQPVSIVGQNINCLCVVQVSFWQHRMAQESLCGLFAGQRLQQLPFCALQQWPLATCSSL